MKGFMTILIASTPAAGHLNPLLSSASLFVQHCHEVAVEVSENLRPAVEAELLSLIEDCVLETARV